MGHFSGMQVFDIYRIVVIVVTFLKTIAYARVRARTSRKVFHEMTTIATKR